MGLPQPSSTAERPKSHLPKAKSPAKAAISNVHNEPKISLSCKTHSEDRSNDEVMELEHHKHVEEENLENLKENYRRDLQRKEAEITAILDQWNNELRELHGRIEKLQQTKLELESKASNLEAADIAVRNAGRDPLAYEIGQKNIEIWMLTSKIHRQFEVSSLKEREAKHLPPQTIDTAMNEIRLELEAMTEMQDFRRMNRPKEWFDGDLTHLVNSAFTSLEGSNHGRLQLERLGVKCGESAVFSILALAALRDWVFLTNFPHIELGSLNLIEAYRNIAFNKGGWVELRLFDVGAFKEHMKQPYFKDLLKRTAKQLSCRLSRTLCPLFGKSLENPGHDFSFHTWGEDSESWKERQYHFERLFRIALELKSDSVITDDNYTFEFSSNQAHANKPFDEPDVPEGSWLRLSICAYKSKPLNSQSEKESALVQTRNFLPSVTEDCFCDYRKNVYLGVSPSQKTQRMLQPNRDLVNISATSGTDNEGSEQNILHPAETNVSEATHNSYPAVIEIPMQSKSILQLPAQLPDMPSKYVCKTCKEEFSRAQGLNSHERNETCKRCHTCKKVWPTIHDLNQHIKKQHMRQFEKSNSSLSVTGGCERPPSAVFSAPKRLTRSNALTERDSSEDTDLDANSTNSSEAVKNREPDIPRAKHEHISSAGKDTQSLDNEISDSFDSDDDEEPELRSSPLHLDSMTDTNNPDLSNVGRSRCSTQSLETNLEESEIKELAIAENNHTTKNIRKSSYELGGNAVILSEELRYGSNLKMDMRLSNSFGVNRETLEVNLKDATLSPSNGKLRDSSENPSTSSSSTDDIDLGNQETLFPERWCLTGDCGTTDVVFESPRLIPERRVSQLYLVSTEDEEPEESGADEDHSVVVNDAENVDAEKVEEADTAEDESTEVDENEDDERNENESIEAGHDDNFQMKEDERHGVDKEDAVKLQDNESIEDDICEAAEADNDENGGVAGKEATEAKKGNLYEVIEKAATETGDEVTINRYVDVENEDNVENHDNGILERWVISCEGPINETAEVERDETIEVDEKGKLQSREVVVENKNKLEDEYNEYLRLRNIEENETDIDEIVEQYFEKTVEVENDDSIEVDDKMNCQECEVVEKGVHGNLIITVERPKYGPESEVEEEVVDLNESMEIDSDNIARAENGDSKMNTQDEEFPTDQTSVADNDSDIKADYFDYSPAREVERDTMNEGIKVDSDGTAEAQNGKIILAADKTIDKQEEHQNSETTQSGDELKYPSSVLTGAQEPRSKFGNEGVSAGSFPWNILKNPSIFSLRKGQQQDTESRLKTQSEESRDMEVQEGEDEVQGVSTEFAED